VPPFLARLCLLVMALLVTVTLVIHWRFSPPPPSPQVVPLPQTLLPSVPLPSGTDPESTALRRAILNGEHIYQQLCFHCHGRQGKGNQNEYMASIGHKPVDHTDLAKMQTLTDQEFFLALRDGVQDERGWLTMPPWESVLTPAEMWDVIAYVRRLPQAELPGSHTPEPAAPAARP